MARGEPVNSIDAKKKEVLANYQAIGQRYEPVGSPTRVSTHDFPSPELERALPYGLYDLALNTGFVSVGVSSDTAEFAVSSIEAWWDIEGRLLYPQASRLLLTADCGGSNGRRNRLWKRELSRFAKESQLEISVCHFPPGTSKWNKIEHRLFSQISRNMRGVPLTDRCVVLGLIGNTTTQRGLTVTAVLDERVYLKGIKVSDTEFHALPVVGDPWRPDWNYTVLPTGW